MFTVVVPLYNKELSIQNTLQSVLNQTYKDFEIVVINDGSIDNSVKIVESIKDDRIRLIHQPNQGVSSARNCGIKEAKYEWIAFLDGDDLWKTNHLEELAKMMLTFPKYKVYVTSFEFSDNRYIYRHDRVQPVFKIENYFKEAIKESLVSSSNVVIHQSCFKEINAFNINLSRGEDLDLWARLAKKYDIIKSVKVTAIYRVEAENRSFITRDVEATHVYYFDFNDDCVCFEREYYKNFLLNRLYNYIRLGYFSSFMKLKLKFPEVTFIEIFIFFINRVREKFKI